jgi:hypothetical protein
MNTTLVDEVISFYYTQLRKALSNLECHNIQVENLGSFKVKQKELPKLIKKYEKHLSVIEPETFNQMAIKKDVEEKLEKVLAVYELMVSDNKRKLKFYKTKNESNT